MTRAGHRPPADQPPPPGRLAGTALLAGVAAVLATPVLTWWLVGDLTEADPSLGLDYVVRPLPLDPWVEPAAGAASAVVTGAAVLYLIRASVRRTADPRWWFVLAPLLAVGIVGGLGWRVLTAGVIGANIGAGFVVIVGGPCALVLLLAAGAATAYLVSARRPCGPYRC